VKLFVILLVCFLDEYCTSIAPIESVNRILEEKKKKGVKGGYADLYGQWRLHHDPL
jgi:hypothetical protein